MLSKISIGKPKNLKPSINKIIFCILFCFASNTQLIGFERLEIHQRAASLYSEGLEALIPLLDKSYIKYYPSPESYILHFPLSNYSVVTIPQQGMFYVDRINDSIKNWLRNRKPWELLNKEIIEMYVMPDTVALDIGSHIGTHTVTMSKLVGSEGQVWAFEPNHKIYRELCMNLALNECGNTKAVRCALDNEKKLVRVIASHPQNEGGSYVTPCKEGENIAAAIRLDDLELTNISFIKIDVENMEKAVIEGAIETIQRCRPVMLVEIQGNGERPIQLGENSDKMGKESILLIESLGYELIRVGTSVDYLAIPKEI